MCLGYAGSGRWLASVLAIALGERHDPAVALRVQLFDAWRITWGAFDDQQRRLVALAWRGGLPVRAHAPGLGDASSRVL